MEPKPDCWKLARWAGYAAMGPLTGPFVAGVVRSLKNRDWILAGLYAVALVATPIALAKLAVIIWAPILSQAG